LGRKRKEKQARGKRGEFGWGFLSVFFIFFSVFVFKKNLFQIKILNANKFKLEANNTK